MSIDTLLQYICKKSYNIVDAMEMIDKNAEGTVFVVDDNNKLIGCVTDGDIRRWLIKTGDLIATVESVMTKSPFFLYERDKKKAYAVMSRESITAIPIVNKKNEIVDIIFLSDAGLEKSYDRKNLSDVFVVIMAGGRGVRLYPYTKILPKPLIPIGEIPIVERIIDSFRKYDANSFYMTLNYKKGMIKSYFQELVPEYSVEFVEENIPLGTAGSIRLIKRTNDKPFFVTNCDILIMADYTDIYDYHIKASNDITIVSALKNMTIPYGVLITGDSGELKTIKEKPKNSYLINTGMYVLNPELIKMIPEDKEYHMTDLIRDIIKENGKVGMYPISEDSFLDMGEFSEMKRMEDKLSMAIE